MGTMDTILRAFLRQYLGVANAGTNPVNKGQCVGLVELWSAHLGKQWIPGNAKDLLGLANRAQWLVVANTPENVPPDGAIVCWGATWGAGFGHTAVVLAANVNWLVVFEQNDPDGMPPIVGTHGYNGVAGWLVAR